ncbi:MAG: hypothetical protein MZV65_31565 [Chromatiales bacterium]|nr:hypothetical protein [Chromatiales bacterium]
MANLLRYLPAFFSRAPDSVTASVTAPIEQGLDDIQAAVPEAVDQIALISADENLA